MKRAFRVLSMVLAAVLTVQLYAPAAFAASDEMQLNSGIYYYEINEENHTVEAVSQINSGVFYTYSDENFSYCAQIIQEGKIQFSYCQVDDDRLVESEIYEMADIYSAYSIEQSTDQNYLKLNRAIMDNIGSYYNVHVVGGATVMGAKTENGVMAAAAYDDLSDAIEAKFGATYTGLFKGVSNKTYNGTTYTVKCTESQTTSYTTPDSKWFAKDTAVSAIVAWAIGGAWTWQAAVLSVIGTVVATVVVNGVQKTVDNFTAQRTNVSLMHTRLVTVNGYSGTQYWAGWTRKTYFFKGADGWASDTGENWDVKHSDFDDVSGLMATGWQNFLNYTLTGGY